jgi:hypothetical protein
VASLRGNFWLAVRLAFRRGGGNAALMSVLAVGMLFLTMLALGTLAIPQVASAQQQREERITPHVAAFGAKTGPANLRTISSGDLTERRWDGHSIIRSFYARGDSSLVAPGVPRMPDVGQFYASAELKQLIQENPTVAGLFHDQTMLGTISDAGLTQPHELRAIVGVADGRSLLSVERFGSNQRLGLPEDNTVLNGAVAVIVTLVVWLPGIAFIVIVTRLASRQRQHRARSMRLLGVSRSVTRVIHAGETMIITFPAAVLGALGYELFVRTVTRIPGTTFGYFTSDVNLGPGQFLAIILLLTLVAGLSTAFSLRLDRRDAADVPIAPPVRLAAFGQLLLVAGMIYLLATPVLATVMGTPAILGMWAACGAVGAGFALAGPRLVVGIFSRFVRRARAGGTLVGLRLHSSGAGTTLKLGSLLGVIIVLMLGTLSFMSILNGGSTKNWEEILATHEQVPVIVRDLDGALTLPRVNEIYSAGAAVQAKTLGKGQGFPVVFGSCVALERLTGIAPKHCSGKPQWIKISGSEDSYRVPAAKIVRVPGKGKVALPEPTAVTELTGMPEQFNAALLLPPRWANTESVGDGSTFFLLVKNVSLNETLARLAATSPWISFDLGELYRHNPDTRRFPTQLQWLTVGAGTGLAVGALALAAATLAETRERSTRMRGLRLLGTPWNQLIRAHFWSAGAPLLLLGWLATLVGWLAARAIRGVDDRAVVSLTATAWTAGSVLAVGLIITVVTLPDALKSAPRAGELNA